MSKGLNDWMLEYYSNITVDSQGFVNVIQHAHSDTICLHLDVDITGGTTQDFIVIDISDTTNYKHTSTGYLHIERFDIHIDAETNASYSLRFGYLENVDGTNGDFIEVFHISGTKQTGVNKDVIYVQNPTGPKLNSSFIVSSDKDLNDTAFQTDVNLASTLDPATADTPSGNGDLVMRVATNSGANTDINLELSIAYHSHE